jgi:hypothetical protein
LVRSVRGIERGERDFASRSHQIVRTRRRISPQVKDSLGQRFGGGGFGGKNRSHHEANCPASCAATIMKHRGHTARPESLHPITDSLLGSEAFLNKYLNSLNALNSLRGVHGRFMGSALVLADLPMGHEPAGLGRATCPTEPMGVDQRSDRLGKDTSPYRRFMERCSLSSWAMVSSSFLAMCCWRSTEVILPSRRSAT